ncbi:hypothetical protein HYU89_04680 [Candidatus Collierbacteria bacterium]|nr:hypothetical protein [Candidatus Collierbacteria bacterium]
MDGLKDNNNLKLVRRQQVELKLSDRASNRRKRAKETSGPRWAGLFLFIVTLLVSLFFYLKGGE